MVGAAIALFFRSMHVSFSDWTTTPFSIEIILKTFFFFDEQATGVQGMNKCPWLGPDWLSRNEDPGTIV